MHGFLTLRSPEGAIIAGGDLTQVAQGDRVTSRLVFHFKDGSLQDETAVFSQRGHFQLVSDHLVQKGRAFERPLDMRIDGQSGQVTVRYLDEDGQEKTESERMELAPDRQRHDHHAAEERAPRQRCRPPFRSWPPRPSRDW